MLTAASRTLASLAAAAASPSSSTTTPRLHGSLPAAATVVARCCFSGGGGGDDDGGDQQGRRRRRRSLPRDGMTLSHFLASSSSSSTSASSPTNGRIDAGNGGGGGFLADEMTPPPVAAPLDDDDCYDDVDDRSDYRGKGGRGDQRRRKTGGRRTLKFHLKTYGCQMNVGDSDIVRSILLNRDDGRHHRRVVRGRRDAAAGGVVGDVVSFEETDDEMDADVLLTNTCAIRENAEVKVWNRLRELRSRDAKFPLDSIRASSSRRDDSGHSGDDIDRSLQELRQQQRPQRWAGKKKKNSRRKRVIGVLGCMAERLKEDMFKDGTADLIVGPDAYRDLPRLISILAPPPPLDYESGDKRGLEDVMGGGGTLQQVEKAVNVQLSLDETYADVTPVRSNPDDVSAFVSVMRGCNNMCSYCVVPFTRGRERSRELVSVVGEVTRLVEVDGVKEVVLLGQNVNSYHDRSENAILARPEPSSKSNGASSSTMTTTGAATPGYRTSNAGFTNLYRLRGGAGYYFSDLVEAVSDVDPELRVRFTSPHPKDYPPELLQLMAERDNVCKQLHMPAQSGSSAVLERMRRGYSREAYLDLIDDVRSTIPDVALSSDFIAGFCGETEQEHLETLTLMERVKYDQAYMFAYSMRGRTHAHRNMKDDVPEDVKSRRLNEIIKVFRSEVQRRNEEMEVGHLRLVLVEGESRRSTVENRSLSGRTDQNKRIVFPSDSGSNGCWVEEEVRPFLSALRNTIDSTRDHRGVSAENASLGIEPRTKVQLQPGDYAVVEVIEARGHTLKGRALWRASLCGFNEMELGARSLQSNEATRTNQNIIATLCTAFDGGEGVYGNVKDFRMREIVQNQATLAHYAPCFGTRLDSKIALNA